MTDYKGERGSQKPVISVRRATVSDMDGIKLFYECYYSDWRGLSDMDLWQWKFMAHSSGDDASFYVLLADTEVVGTIGYIPLRVQCVNDVISSCLPVNYFVAPKYQGLPALRLIQTVLSDFSVVIAANMSEDAKRLFPKLGFIDVSDKVKSYYITLSSSVDHSLGRWLKNLSLYPLQRLRISLLSLHARQSIPEKVTYSISKSLDTGFSELCQGTRPSYFGIAKDQSYVEWRWESSPNRKLMFVHQSYGGKPDAMAVLQIEPSTKTAVLLDVLARDFTSLSITLLICEVLGYCKGEGICSVTSELVDKSIEKSLRSIGFRHIESDIGLMFYFRDKAERKARKTFVEKHAGFIVGDTDAL